MTNVKCRLCLILNPSAQCYNVLEKVTELEMKSTVIDILTFCVPQIRNDVSTTDCICHQCLEELNACYEFIQTCISNNDILQTDISENKPNESKNFDHIETKQDSSCDYITEVKTEPEYGCEEHITEPPSHLYLEDFQVKSEPNEHLTGHLDMEVLECSDSDMDLTALADDTELIKAHIPESSKDRYYWAYNMFWEWCVREHSQSLSENVFLEYFAELAKRSKPSTLLTHYSWLRATVKINNNVDIGIYLKLKKFLKEKATGYVPQKTKVFTSEEVNRFLEEAPNDNYLLAKLVLIMGVSGACRRHEIDQLKITDIKDLGSAAIISVRPKVKTKSTRSFTLTGSSYEILKKFINLRPKKADESLFLNYQNGKCSVHKMGINKIGNVVKQIATFLNLPNPELYTGRCFWRSPATISLH